VVLDAFPLTGTGKVNRRALPAPAPSVAAEPARGPTPTETALAAMWRELLGVPRVGRGDSFFALGGHSLPAMRMLAAVHARLGVSLPLRDVFDHPRLADLADRVDRVRGRSLDAILGEIGLSEDDARAVFEGASLVSAQADCVPL
jgi:hypothetical protein